MTRVAMKPTMSIAGGRWAVPGTLLGQNAIGRRRALQRAIPVRPPAPERARLKALEERVVAAEDQVVPVLTKVHVKRLTIVAEDQIVDRHRTKVRAKPL